MLIAKQLSIHSIYILTLHLVIKMLYINFITSLLINLEFLYEAVESLFTHLNYCYWFRSVVTMYNKRILD